MACIVCGTELKDEEIECPYCGRVDVVVLDEASKAAVTKDAAAYRKAIVDKLKNFTIDAYAYKYDAGQFIEDKKRSIKICDGKDCARSIKWSKESFAQYHEKKNGSLTIHYEMDGQKKRGAFGIAFPDTGDFWKIGLKIGNNLRLQAYVGTEDKYSIVNDVPLSLI